ncbi:hypothetical protein [Chitinophaga sp.]|uniref:hypothetical protein n=1 Tax=Chitinophaga sp. TaxID=1869181 RepID=UPI0031D1E274
MKRLLLSALILLFFSASLFLTQMSCRKESKAETPVDYPQRFVFTKDTRGQSSEIWISKIDGTDQQKLNITLPAGEFIAPQARITANKQGVVFVAMDAEEKETGIYYCKLDGTGLKKVAEAPTGTNTGLTLQDTF